MMRPVLTIAYMSTTSIGKYCSSIRYRVVSSGKRLSEEQLNMLFQARLLGVGQEFRIVTRCDADMPPAGHDECSLVYNDTGEPCPGDYSLLDRPYYVYETETICDSGD